MKAASRSPAVDRAFGFLQSVVAQAQSSGRSRLPTVRVMARNAGVSLVTMWKAVQRLIEAGEIYSAQRGGLVLKGAADVHDLGRNALFEASSADRSVWATTAARMERDILNRAFAPGPALPSAKELQSRYGVSYLTLRKAVDNLVSRGIIVPHHRGFALPPVRPQRAYSRIVLLSARRFAKEIENKELSLGILGQEGIRQLELESSKAGIFLDAYYYYQEGERIVFCSTDDDRPVGLLDDENTLGYLWLITGTEVPLNIDVGQIAEKLTRYRKPVSVFSEIAEATPRLRAERAAHFRLFPVALDEKPATVVARHLLHLGHRRIAYISPFHCYSWSHARFAGLDSTYATAGYAEAVAAFVIDSFKDTNDFYALAATHGDLASLRDPIQRWRRRAPAAIARQIAAPLDYALRVGFEMGEMEHQLQPLFAQALLDKEITAWVAANDSIACMALEFLKCHSTRVPQDLSLISFDDTLEATIHQLTSYDFNLPAYLTAMLAHVLRRTSFPHRVVEIDGWIVQRRTTGGVTGPAGTGG